MARGGLDRYSFAHDARADMERRLGRRMAARESYSLALALTEQAAERRFLSARIAALDDETGRHVAPIWNR
jgi:RNA polymerase sigma-70 factor (ECF subfamily)